MTRIRSHSGKPAKEHGELNVKKKVMSKIINYIDRYKASQEIEDIKKTLEPMYYRGIVPARIYKALKKYSEDLFDLIQEFDKNNLENNSKKVL
jgi:hypothetical protein